jgi:hypothetical protein
VCVYGICDFSLYLPNVDLEISEVFESRRGNINISINNFKFANYRALKSGYIIYTRYNVIFYTINTYQRSIFDQPYNRTNNVDCIFF